MRCPLCQHENLQGADQCEACNASLIDEQGSELELSIARHAVRVLVPSEPLSVAPQATVRDAISEMMGRNVGAAIVQEGDRLLGIFSERDVLNKISGDLSTLDRPVQEFMTANPETVTGEDSIAYMLHAMHLGGYRHMPVVNDNGEATGILSVRDMLRFLCVRFAGSHQEHASGSDNGQ